MMPILKISADQDDKRLDVILARAYPDHSRGFLQKWIKEGRVSRNGKELRVPNTHVRAGETIAVAAFEQSSPNRLLATSPVGRGPAQARSEGLPSIKILFEDKALLVINKPAGLVVHPAPSHKGLTLVDWLADYLGPKVTGLFMDGSRLGVVHRLDKDTTGVLLIAKTVVAQHLVSKQFQDRKVNKTYAAFIEGIPESLTGIISAPVGRSHNVPSRMAVSSSGRPSETSFEVVQKFREVTQVNLHPKTGRTHQIRVHCSAIGHPVVGDVVYGSSLKWAKEFGIHRPMLHAERLELEHPTTHKKISFQAPWAQDMKKALTLFRNSMQAVILTGVLLAGVLPARADQEGATHAAKPKPKSTAARSTGSSQALKKEMASIQLQFKSLIEEVSALQDRVNGIQSSLDELDASKRLRDLEKSISDLNGKAVGNAAVAEESKSQSLDIGHKVKAQQDILDQLRDQVDRLQRELIQTKAREEQPPAEKASEGTAERGTGR